jgi:hypothetical protein
LVQEIIGEKIPTYMMLRQRGSRHAALRMDMQNDYTKRIKDIFPGNHQELQWEFESLSFSKHVGSQSSHGTAFFQQQQQTKGYKKKPRQVGREDKQASYEKKAYTRPDAHLPPYNNGLTESAPTVASKAIFILTVTRFSELILQLLPISTLYPTLIFQLQSPLSLYDREHSLLDHLGINPY